MNRIEATKTPESSFQMADHRTPLILNCWYVVTLADDVGRELKSFRLLGTSVLLYRTESGLPVAMENRCVHRSFPLDRSRLEGDHVRCGYHGMVFDAKGQCIEMPSLPRAPQHAKVRSYPVLERGPLIWIWMGDPAKADYSRIPDLDWIGASDWRTVSGRCEVETSYVAMHENLLDHTHFPVLHGQAVGSEDLMNSEFIVREEDDRVFMTRERRNRPLPGIFAHMTQLGEKPVDSRSDNRFDSPAAHVSKSSHVLRDTEGPHRAFDINIVHLFTPVGQNRIRYWWFFSRNFRLDDPQLDEFLVMGVNKAFNEDRDALGWIQALKEAVGDASVPELSFASDRAGMLMRRAILRMSRAEQIG